MVNINLLPWRKQQGVREQKQVWYVLIAGMFSTTLMVCLLSYVVQHRLLRQQRCNQHLEAQIGPLEHQLERLKIIRRHRQRDIDRLMLITSIQRDRLSIPRFMDDLFHVVPQSIYLTRLTRQGQVIQLSGYATSNADISQLLLNIEAGSWAKSVHVVEIKHQEATSHEKIRFDVQLMLNTEALGRGE